MQSLIGGRSVCEGELISEAVPSAVEVGGSEGGDGEGTGFGRWRKNHSLTMSVSIGVNFEGKKELLGLRLNEADGARFWLSWLTDWKNRGVTDIFITCVDGLTGFPEAIHTAFPQGRVQLCIVPLVRAALKSVTDADSREVIRDLRHIYQAATVLEAE